MDSRRRGNDPVGGKVRGGGGLGFRHHRRGVAIGLTLALAREQHNRMTTAHWPKYLFPARLGLVVGGFGFDPVGAGGGGFLLPEGGVGFEVVHQQLGGVEGGLAVGG